MADILTGITWWHWLALALVLFGLEVVTGTYDLLMASIGAVITAAFAAFLPSVFGGWQGQVVVFAIASIGLIVGSRFVFPGLRKAAPEHPTLNRRMEQLIGQQGEATRAFGGGTAGQVKIGDTVWAAELADGHGEIDPGQRVIVMATRSNLVIVRKA